MIEAGLTTLMMNMSKQGPNSRLKKVEPRPRRKAKGFRVRTCRVVRFLPVLIFKMIIQERIRKTLNLRHCSEIIITREKRRSKKLHKCMINQKVQKCMVKLKQHTVVLEVHTNK